MNSARCSNAWSGVRTRGVLRHLLGGLLVLAILPWAGCDGGLAPQEEEGDGAIRGIVTYTPVEAWPPADSLHDLRFIALPYVPRDTLDLFRDISNLVFSPGLRRNVERDTFFIDEVPAKNYIYSGIARQFTRSLFDWQPLAIYENNGGIITVRPGEVTEIAITVDFDDIPIFPPPVGE